jgi:GxxExxY protein
MSQMNGARAPVIEADPLSASVIGAAIEVHRHLGPGLLESVYETCLCRELTLRGVPFRAQVELPVIYKGEQTGQTLRIDLIVADSLIVEIKTIEKLLPIHDAQLLTYLRLTKIHTGLLLNFNSAYLKDGIKRLVL